MKDSLTYPERRDGLERGVDLAFQLLLCFFYALIEGL